MSELAGGNIRIHIIISSWFKLTTFRFFFTSILKGSLDFRSKKTTKKQHPFLHSSKQRSSVVVLGHDIICCICWRFGICLGRSMGSSRNFSTREESKEGFGELPRIYTDLFQKKYATSSNWIISPIFKINISNKHLWNHHLDNLFFQPFSFQKKSSFPSLSFSEGLPSPKKDIKNPSKAL